MADLSRRDFLKIITTTLLTTSGLLSIAGLFHFLDFQTEPPVKTVFDLGLESNYPDGSRTLLPDIPAILFHTPSGFRALSLVCTHLGCTVEQKDNGYTCPCHGSQYNEDGKVMRGPAQKALAALRIETTSAGHLILHTD